MIGPVTSSGEQSASGVVYPRCAGLHSFEFLPPTTSTSTLKIYDSATATTSGKLLLASATVSAGQNSIYLNYGVPRVCNQGIYCVLSGSATTFVIGFSAM